MGTSNFQSLFLVCVQEHLSICLGSALGNVHELLEMEDDFQTFQPSLDAILIAVISLICLF